MGMTGRAWWNIDIAAMQARLMRGDSLRLANETPAGLDEARACLSACLDALVKERHISRERLILGGFSQGAMLSTEVALHAPEPFAGIVLMSGALISADRWRDAAKQTGAQIHALASHGRADPLLPFEGGEALRTLLEDAGARVEWVPHNGQHEIPPVVLDRLGAFARSRFTAHTG
jgi:phospholipase/carboxylesterase